MDDTKINVVNESGEELTIDVIDIFSVDGNDKEYILYTIEDDIYASILEEDETTFSLKTIVSDDEKQLINDRISELIS